MTVGDSIAAKHAVEYARKWAVDGEKGSLLLEFVTYRYGGSFVRPFLNSCSYGRHLTPISTRLQHVRPRNHLPSPARKTNACVAPKILFVGCRSILRHGIWLPSRS